MTSQRLILLLDADNKELKAKLDEAEKHAKKTATGMQSGFSSLNLRNLLYGTFGLYAVKRAMEQVMKPAVAFETELAKVSTMLDKSTMGYMKRYREGLQTLSVQFGESTSTLSKGLYDILSASIPAAGALNVLTVSARAAIAGLTTTAVAADVITTILNSYNMEATKAQYVSDILFATVKRGKTEFDELATSTGMVVSTAAQVGLEFEEVAAALSTMTRQGINVHRATYSLMNLLNSFLTPTEDAQEAAKKFGIELDVAWLKAYKFEEILRRLSKATAGEVATIFPSVRGLRGFNAVLGDTKGYLNDLMLMYNSTGLTTEALGKRVETLSIKFSRLKQEVIKATVALGDELKPTVDKMTDDTINWVKENKKTTDSIGKSFEYLGNEVYQLMKNHANLFTYLSKGFSRLLAEITSVIYMLNKFAEIYEKIPTVREMVIYVTYKIFGEPPAGVEGINVGESKNTLYEGLGKGHWVNKFNTETGLPEFYFQKDYTPAPLSKEKTTELREAIKQKEIERYELEKWFTSYYEQIDEYTRFLEKILPIQGHAVELRRKAESFEFKLGADYELGKAKGFQSKLGTGALGMEYKPTKEASEYSRRTLYETELAKVELIKDFVKQQQAILVMQRDWEIDNMKRMPETLGERKLLEQQIIEKYEAQKLLIVDKSTNEMANMWWSLSDQMSNAMANAAMQSGNAFKNIGNAFWQMLQKMAADFAAKAVIFGLLKLIGVGFVSDMGILDFAFGKKSKGFASGGMAYTPQLAVVGEHGPERILNPEETRQYNKSISDDHSRLTINYYGGAQPDMNFIDKLRTAWRDGELEFLRS